MRIRPDGELDFAAYADDELQQAIRSLDRNQFPINFQRLCAELDSRAVPAVIEHDSSPPTPLKKSLKWVEPGHHLAAENARKGVSNALFRACVAGLLLGLVMMAITYLLHDSFRLMEGMAIVLALPAVFAFIVYARRKIGRPAAVTKDSLVVVKLGSRYVTVIKYADMETCTLCRLTGPQGDYAVLEIKRDKRPGRVVVELPQGELEQELLEFLKIAGVDVQQ